MQNDAALRNVVLGHGVYPMPVGGVGLSMVDTRDIAEVTALHLMRRERAVSPLPRETMDIVGPDVLTDGAIAGIWTETLARAIHYAGDDLAAIEQRFRAFAPGWMAYEMRLMMARFQRDGMVATSGDVDRLTALLGRPLRSYRDFAAETAKQWQGA
jgi:uncharacterized protein YbjT (DUF2867 family)